MTKRIFRSICTVAIVVLLASLILIVGVLYNYFSEAQMNQLKAQTTLTAKGVSQSGISFFDGLDTGKYRITWIDKDGTVKYDSKVEKGGMENHLEREEIKEAIETGYGESYRYSTTLLERQLYSAISLSDGTIIRMSTYQNTWWALLLDMLHPILIVIIIGVCLSLLLAMQLSKKIVQPLNELDLDHPENVQAYKEIQPLLDKIHSGKNKYNVTEQIRKEFTANVSHELKTPLQNISGSAEILCSGIVKDEDIPKFSKQIYNESKRMISLVEDIIGLSHLDEGASDMVREAIDLYSIANDTVESLKPIADNAGITLNINGETAMMTGIPELINAIVFNLCDNAIKYNKTGGRVFVKVHNDADRTVLTVKDNGIGIPEEQQDRIFERFYRVDKSRSKEVGGTGLGLSIVKHAAILHNAKISLESKLGEGTSITVEFPKK